MGAWIETKSEKTAKPPDVTSHPVWVRGLKQLSEDGHLLVAVSHPVWVRGLKHIAQGLYMPLYWSHPVWVRGLKHQPKETDDELNQVAPCMGAWIETTSMYL